MGAEQSGKFNRNAVAGAVCLVGIGLFALWGLWYTLWPKPNSIALNDAPSRNTNSGISPNSPRVPLPSKLAAPVIIAPNTFNLSTSAQTDPVEYALHPSHVADTSHIVQNIGLAVINPDPDEPAAAPTSSPAPSTSSGQASDGYSDAIRMEKDRAITMASCTDKQGRLWLATEGFGVQCWDPNKPPLTAWTEYNTKNSNLLDDWCYAIACDPLGRIFVGTLDHGLAVFDGRRWQTYEVLAGLSAPDTLAGPIGSRVFKIVVDNKDGDVWAATEWGLCRYSQSKNTWSYFTKAEGLVSDQINSLAFDEEGNCYAASQCDGISIANAAGNYTKWQTITGPIDEPMTPVGKGLPSNLMNDILVAADGTVYASTDAGLAWSKDGGQSWQYVRGRNYADKIRLAVGGPPKGWTEQPGAFLSEDYCTCLADAGSNGVWVGHRETAAELVNVNAGTATAAGSPVYSECVATAAGHVIFGTCADGLVNDATLSSSLAPGPSPSGALPPMPAGAAVLSDAQLSALTALFHSRSTNGATGAYFGEDWATQGDWPLHYGIDLAVLCGSAGLADHYGTWDNDYNLTRFIGPHVLNGDKLRAWIETNSTDDQRALYDTVVHRRVISQYDDRGEVYPPSFDGPDVMLNVKIPNGTNVISLYLLNDNGQSGRNRNRDFVIQIWRSPTSFAAAFAAPPLASARVQNFRGGVYKRLWVVGAGNYLIRIRRNHSLNANIDGVFVDRVDAAAATLRGRQMPPGLNDVVYGPPKLPTPSSTAPPSAPSSDVLRRIRLEAGHVYGNREPLLLSLRRVPVTNDTADLRAWYRWQLCLWSAADRKGFADAMDSGAKAEAAQDAADADEMKKTDDHLATTSQPASRRSQLNATNP